MKTKLDRWINTETMTDCFGVSVQKDGKWMRVARNKEAFIVGSREEAEAMQQRLEQTQ